MSQNKGDLIILENHKEYVCFEKITFEGIEYLYLMSNFKPLEIRFAKVIKEDEIEIIYNQEEKEKLGKLFKFYKIF